MVDPSKLRLTDPTYKVRIKLNGYCKTKNPDIKVLFSSQSEYEHYPLDRTQEWFTVTAQLTKINWETFCWTVKCHNYIIPVMFII